MSHRYWRARNLIPYDFGTQVALSEFWLLAGGSRVDTSATLTCSESPVSGTLANLSDNDTGTDCVLPASAVLTWDFGGSPAAVDDIRLGSTGSFDKFLAVCRVEWSDDGSAWVSYEWGDPSQRPAVFAWPGARTLTGTLDQKGWSTREGSLLVGAAFDNENTEFYTTTPLSAGIASLSAASSGVRQAEYRWLSGASYGTTNAFGLIVGTTNVPNAGSSGAYMIRPTGGTKSAASASWTSYPVGGFTTSDVLGVVVNFATGDVTFYKNGVSLGSAFTLPSGNVWRLSHQQSGGITRIKLATGGFTYPIAGAEPWTRETIVTGFITAQPREFEVDSLGAQPDFLSATLLDVNKARPNFILDPAGSHDGKVYGTVKTKATPDNLPVFRRVRLHRDIDGLLVGETWSDPVTGYYEFLYVERGVKYTVISYDHTHDKRAVIADNLEAEQM